MRIFFAILLLSIVSIPDCLAQKKRQMPEMTFPPELPDSLHAMLNKQYRKGFDLYMASCNGCHSSGGQAIPVFSSSQLGNYQMRTSKGHMGEITERKVSEGELSLIVTFLSQIKQSQKD